MSDPAEQMAYEAGLDTARGGKCLTDDDLCEECDHPIRLHADEYGCEYERGDIWIEGVNCGGWVAAGPCGCKSHADLRELKAKKREVERLLFANGGLRNFLTVRRGA